MSKEEQRQDSILVEDVAQQLNLYDNLFPQVENKELQALFALIRIYLARCDNPGLKQEYLAIKPELLKRLTVSYFNPFNTATGRSVKEALVSRLNSIRKYRISNPEAVRRTLITCFYHEKKKVYSKQKTYLDAFMKNPNKSFTDIAKSLGVTPQAVSQAYHSLQKSDLFYFYGYINYPMFKLKHYVAFFTLMREHGRNTDELRRLFLNSSPFTMSLNIDIYEGSSWASFAVPNQNKEIQRFKDSLNELRGEIFHDIKICSSESFSTNSNLEFFDGKQWFFDPQLWAYGFFEFIRENKEILRRATEFSYSREAADFDRIDFLIATMLGANPLVSHDEIRKQLKDFGYCLSRPTITRRVTRLVNPEKRSNTREVPQPAIYPYMTYWGLGLSTMSAYLIECDQDRVEDLYYAVNYLPYYFLYRMDRGVLLFIKSTVEDAAKINYMIKGIDEIAVVAHSNRFENVGTRTLTHLHELWDETKHKWTCIRDELDFAKRYEQLP